MVDNRPTSAERIPEIGFRPLTVSNKGGFELISLESFFRRNVSPTGQNPFAYHRLKFYAIFIMTGGEAQHLVDFHTCPLRRGHCLMIAKEQIHAFDQDGIYQGYLIVFTDAFLIKYFSKSSLDHLTYLFDYFSGIKQFEAEEESQVFIQGMDQEVAAVPPRFKIDIAASLLSNFLLKLTIKRETLSQQAFHRHQDVYNQFRLLIEQDYTHSRDAKQYAEKLNVSYKHLNEVCKAISNKTPKRLIDDYVMLEAKRYLVATSDSVKEIGYTLGFDEPTNFQKYFKRHTNLTALEFRLSSS